MDPNGPPPYTQAPLAQHPQQPQQQQHYQPEIMPIQPQPQVMMMQSDVKGAAAPQPMYNQPMYQQPMQYDTKGSPAPQGYPPMQPAGAAYLTVAVTPLQNLAASPAVIDCPCCHQRVLTSTQFRIGNTNHAWGLGLLFLTCHLCWVPYLFSSLKNVEHRCGQCNTLLATWHRSGKTIVHFHPQA